MPTYMVEYIYDDRSHLRDAHRPEHRAYLASLVQTGKMIAFGRYDDTESPGALLLFESSTSEEVEGMVRRDPDVTQGLSQLRAGIRGRRFFPPRPLPPAPPMTFNILRICANCLSNRFTSSTEVPLPLAMRLRQLPLMI